MLFAGIHKPEKADRNNNWLYIHTSFSSLPLLSMADYIKYLSYLLSLTIYIDSFPHYFRNYINPNPPHPVNYPCARRPVETSNSTFRQYINLLVVRFAHLYNNVTSVCIGCWPWSHTHTHTSDHVSRIVFLFSCPKNPSINHMNFYFIKQIDNIFPCVCVYCNWSQKTSQRVKNNSHVTRLRLVPYFFVLYTLWRHLWSITSIC